MQMPAEKLVGCEELLQLVSYEMPMESAVDIRFEELESTQELLKLLRVQVTQEAVDRFESGVGMGSIAIFKVRKLLASDTTLITFSSEASERLAKYFGQVLSMVVLALSVMSAVYLKWRDGEFRVPFVIIWTVCVMLLGETTLPHSTYLLAYGTSLVIGFYFV
jgi:hypothetical protein